MTAALGFACGLMLALLLAFICLKFLTGLVTREQYNVTDAPRRVSAIVWNAAEPASAGANDGGSGHATGGPYLLPAAAPRNRFARIPKPDGARASRVIQLPSRAPAGTEENGCGDGDGGAA